MFDVLWSAAIATLIAVQPAPVISPGGIEAIGPKQDDPLTMCEPGTGEGPGLATGIIVQGGRTGIIVQGGRTGAEAIGPKQDDPGRPGGVLAIGPKQDDPSRPGALARPGDDNDPQAFGGQSTNLAIGPKQDDPSRPGALAVVARPGDDEDPQALAKAGKCGIAKG